MPRNFLITGDAACAFNPIYAQGMSTAALGAEILEECLYEAGSEPSGLAGRFQRRLAKANAGPWLLATGEDFRVRGVEGAKPNAVNRLMHRYMDRVLELSTKDPAVRLVLLEAFNLLKPPTALFGPSIVAKALREAVARKRSRGRWSDPRRMRRCKAQRNTRSPQGPPRPTIRRQNAMEIKS
jgi:hypothetical protein